MPPETGVFLRRSSTYTVLKTMAICKTYWAQVMNWAETLICRGEVKLPAAYSAALLKTDLLVALKQLAGESPVKYRLQRRRAPYLHFVLEIRR